MYTGVLDAYEPPFSCLPITLTRSAGDSIGVGGDTARTIGNRTVAGGGDCSH